MRKIDADEQVGEGFLQDWYMNSVHGEPVWTEEHIEELCRDFIVIPKETPTVEEVTGEWIEVKTVSKKCSVCRCANHIHNIYCGICGSKNREVADDK